MEMNFFYMFDEKAFKNYHYLRLFRILRNSLKNYHNKTKNSESIIMTRQTNNMKSKKGVIITVVILIAITAASFSVWIVNNSVNTEMTIVVTDFENHQQGISERYKIVSNAVEESFSELISGKISPEEYIRIAEISSSQNTALLTELRTSNAPEEWQESYINRIGSLENFRSYIIETMVMANMIMDNGTVEQKTEVLDKIEMYKEESIQYAQMADSTKP